MIGLVAIAAIGSACCARWSRRLLARTPPTAVPAARCSSMLLIGTCAMAAATEWLGLHPVFGAFLFGACLPRDDRLLETLIERIEHVAVLVLMPVFFALAGPQHDARCIHRHRPAGAAADPRRRGRRQDARRRRRRAHRGLGWREAGAVGSLMNARGLMELIVMKVGLDAGVIGFEIFTMLMVMAIVTTLMTTPMLRCSCGAARRRRRPRAARHPDARARRRECVHNEPHTRSESMSTARCTMS